MLPDMSYNPLRESGSGEDDNKVRQALKMILEGRGTGAPEFGSVAGSAEHKALMMLGGNTGRFAGNYAVKNYDKLDPIVKEIVGSIDPKMGVYGSRDAFAGDFKAGSEEEKERMKAVKEDPEQRPYSETPRLVKSAVERRAKAEQPSASFMEEQPINFQEGGPVPVDGEGNMPPEAVAGDVINGAPVGMVDVPGGGGPTDDGVPTKLPEGSFVLNAAAIQYHGTKTINDLINNAVRDLLKEGVQISMEDPNPEDDVPVAISNGEYVIPPEVAEKIGIKKLEDMNERGLEYRKKQEEAQKKEAEAQQQQPQPQPQETFMGLQMPPETPQQAAAPASAPVQSEQQVMAMMGMADGGPISKAKDAFVNWFTDTFLGGPMIPTNESVDALLGKPEPQEPQKPPMLPPSVTEQKQEGGFIGQPMSPQQQPNMAISNPYGFSLDNPFSQQPSFIGDAAGNIVGSKKKSRVEFQDGSFVRLPKEKPPVPEKKFPVPKEKPPVPEEGFLPREAPAEEKLMGDPILAEEIAGGSIDDLRRILAAGEHTLKGNTVLKNNKFVVYEDSKGFPTIGGINLNEHPEIAKKVEEAGNSLSFQEYLKYHNKMLSEADKWIENLVKETGNSNYSTAAPVLRDMYFNMGLPRLKKFKKMLEAIGEGNIDDAAANIMFTDPDAKKLVESQYYTDGKNRANRNISRLLKAFKIPTAT